MSKTSSNFTGTLENATHYVSKAPLQRDDLNGYKSLQYLRPNTGRGSQEAGSAWSWPNGPSPLRRGVGGISNVLQGLGIALVAAHKASVPVTLVDNSQAALDKGLKFAGEVQRGQNF